MSVSYDDIMQAVVEAKKNGDDVDAVVLTDESFDTFLADNNFSEETEEEVEEKLGTAWTLHVDTGEEDYLRTTSGDTIEL